MERLKEIMTAFTTAGVNSEPDDSAYNDIFIRPYFEDDRATVFATVSTTFILVKEGRIEATQMSWDFCKNEEIKETLAEMEELRAKYLKT